MLEALRVVELLRALDKCHKWICKKTKGVVQESRRWNEVGIHYSHELARRSRKSKIQVAGLGANVVGPRQVLSADDPTQTAHPWAPAIIKNIGLVWIPHSQSPGNCRREHCERFVVRGNEEIYRESLFCLWRRRWPSIPGHNHEAEKGKVTVHLCQEQRYRQPGCRPIERESSSPDEVDGRHRSCKKCH